MQQGRLLPVRIIDLQPSHLGTADCHSIGIAEDGIAYAIKRVRDGQHIPASEWICSSLAQACGIAVPPFELVELPGNEQAFGSRWEGGILNPQQTLSIWQGNPPMADLPKRLAAVFAFDLFVHNVDRHRNNFLFRSGPQPTSPPVLLAPDYSRALLCHGWPLPDPPPPVGSNTIKTRTVSASIFGGDKRSALIVLDQLKSLNDNVIQNICNSLPSSLLQPDLRDGVHQWWTNQRTQRLDQIRGGFDNGQYI